MRIKLIIAIAYNPEYIKILIENLFWAFQKFDLDIEILTFDEYSQNFKDCFDHKVNFNFYKKPLYSSKEKWWFSFHNNSHDYVLNSKFDYCVFLEQDVFFTNIVSENYFKENELSLFISEDYLSVFEGETKIYPRIWEGCLFAPRDILLKAIDQNVIFGNRNIEPIPNKNKFEFPDFKNLKTRHDGSIVYINDLLREGRSDTMFEFSLWCFLNEIKVNNFSKDNECKEGEVVIHFRGFEILPWLEDKGDKNANDYFYLNYLYLKGLYDPSVIKEVLKIKRVYVLDIFNKLEKINVEWMSCDVLKNHNKFMMYLKKRCAFI